MASPTGPSCSIKPVRRGSRFELTFWESIKDSRAAEFAAYLETLSRGTFAALATPSPDRCWKRRLSGGQSDPEAQRCRAAFWDTIKDSGIPKCTPPTSSVTRRCLSPPWRRFASTRSDHRTPEAPGADKRLMPPVAEDVESMNRRRAAGAEGALATFSRPRKRRKDPWLHRPSIGRACQKASAILSAPPGTVWASTLRCSRPTPPRSSSACSRKAAGARSSASPCRSTPTRSGTVTCPMHGRARSTATACTVPTSLRQATASIPTSC